MIESRYIEQSQEALGQRWRVAPNGLILPTCGLLVPEPRRKPTKAERYKRPVAIDLFCGCGGFSCGFIQAGFQIVAAVDWDATCAFTYTANLGAYPMQFHFVDEADKTRLNKVMAQSARSLGIKTDKQGNIIETDPAKLSRLPRAGEGWLAGVNNGVDRKLPWESDEGHQEQLRQMNPPVPGVGHFWLGDIRKITGQEILDAVGLEVGEVDAVCGGPPCQGFSTDGLQNVMDPRNSLVFEFARLVCEIQPACFVFENVPGIVNMVTPEGIPVVDALCSIFESGGMGTFEALKKSLLGSSGVGAAVRSRPGARADKKAAPSASDQEADNQLAMFA